MKSSDYQHPLHTSADDMLNLGDFEIQDKIFQINEWKYYIIKNNSNQTQYFAKSSSKNLESFTRGMVIDFFRGIINYSKFNHPSILNYVGYSLQNFKNKLKPVIITESSSKYTLKDLLHQNNKNANISDWNDTKKLINIYGIASGMSYLHFHNIIHRNLNLESIFLDNNFYPKITNFDFSKEAPKSDFIEDYQFKGDIKYQPPEVLTNLLYSKSSDVYSFSLVMYSILTNNEPFQKLRKTTEIITNISSKNDRPIFDVPIAKCYQKLIERCWSKDPKERPSFDEIIEELKTNQEFITETVNKEEYENYIKLIEESPQKFSFIDKERKIKENLKSKNLDFDENQLQEIDFTNIKTDFENNDIELTMRSFFNNQYNALTDDYFTILVEFYRKEINFFYRNEIINLFRKLNVISQIDHPAILKFIDFNPDYIDNKQRPVILTEPCSALKENESLLNDKNSFTQKLVIIYGIASAMAYLHSHNIIHRDLKLSNIYT